MYSNISKQLKDLGFKRTLKKCQITIEDMKNSYRQTLRNPSSSGIPIMPGSKDTVKVADGVMSSDEDEGPSVDVESEHLYEEMVSRKGKLKTLTREQTVERKGHEVFHSPQRHSMNIGWKKHCCQQVVDDV